MEKVKWFISENFIEPINEMRFDSANDALIYAANYYNVTNNLIFNDGYQYIASKDGVSVKFKILFRKA